MVSGERPASEQAHSSMDSGKVNEAGDAGLEQDQVPNFVAPVLDVSKVNETLREHHKNVADSSASDEGTTTIVSKASDPKLEDVPKNTTPSGINNFTLIWSGSDFEIYVMQLLIHRNHYVRKPN